MRESAFALRMLARACESEIGGRRTHIVQRQLAARVELEQFGKILALHAHQPIDGEHARTGSDPGTGR